MYSVLLDTNILLDYHLGRGDRAKQCAELIARLLESDSSVMVTATSIKDEFYLIAQALKSECLQRNGTLSASDAQAADAAAWACIQQTMEIAQVVDVGYGDCLRAQMFRSTHADFEDNLIAAAGERGRVDYLVTSDQRFLRHAVIRCLTPAEMIALMDAEAAQA